MTSGSLVGTHPLSQAGRAVHTPHLSSNQTVGGLRTEAAFFLPQVPSMLVLQKWMNEGMTFKNPGHFQPLWPVPYLSNNPTVACSRLAPVTCSSQALCMAVRSWARQAARAAGVTAVSEPRSGQHLGPGRLTKGSETSVLTGCGSRPMPASLMGSARALGYADSRVGPWRVGRRMGCDRGAPAHSGASLPLSALLSRCPGSRLGRERPLLSTRTFCCDPTPGPGGSHPGQQPLRPPEEAALL